MRFALLGLVALGLSACTFSLPAVSTSADTGGGPRDGGITGDDAELEDRPIGPDTGNPKDTGRVDSGVEDAQLEDGGLPDADPPDMGPADTGPPDTGAIDTGPDAGPEDAGPPFPSNVDAINLTFAGAVDINNDQCSIDSNAGSPIVSCYNGGEEWAGTNMLQLSGDPIVVFAAESLRFRGGSGSLDINGNVPVAFITRGDLELDVPVDVNPGMTACVDAFGRDGVGAFGGGGGGFGGFGAQGGGGTLGGAITGALLRPLRGGCPGGAGGGVRGQPGLGGGAFQLSSISGKIDVKKRVTIHGEGGREGLGGGGGGSGGAILVEADDIHIHSNGDIYANGGGGGSGTTDNDGDGDGASGLDSTTNAAPGGNLDANGGAGGVKGTNAQPGETAAQFGGGGGGVGRIVIRTIATGLRDDGDHSPDPIVLFVP